MEAMPIWKHVSKGIAFWAACLLLEGSATAEENWGRFRGPTGRGHTADTDVPVKWDAGAVKWKTRLKGQGQSSPVLAGNRLFLTSASEDGRQRYIHCLDRDSGKVLWEKSFDCPTPETPHKMNSFATPTCATDGRHVVAFFGPGGLHCLDLDGNTLWSKNLGTFPGVWGIAASPILHEGKVIQNCDAEGPSSIVALDLKTGKEVWKTERAEKPRGGWSTPILIQTGGHEELVLNGEFGVRGYDPATGRELWFCKGFNGRGAPVPDYADNTLYVVNGKPGDLYAVKPGGQGDVTSSSMVWHSMRRGGRDLPSPAVVGDHVLVLSMSGITTCYNRADGQMLWYERLPVKGEFAASPLVANGLVYFQNVYGGETLVLRPGPALDVVSINPLGADREELFRAAFLPVGGRLYTRSDTTVYCIQP